ncbi:MAG: phosphodiester glycosidase family protein [Verrucomicrobiales bacterium]|nr:phosphodiester glycosidase family protein [Verrucomicrobiales bacterium]
MNIFPAALLLLLTSAASAQWKIVDSSPAADPSSPLIYERKTVSRTGETGFFSAKRIDLVWFNASTHTFRVIDNGGGTPLFPDLVTAMRENNCLAGVNGGFFLKNDAPSGLMISAGNETGKFGTGGLLSGVLLSSGNINPYLLRRAEYSGSKYKPTDLIQAGPFLVDQGAKVKGLSPNNSRRRSIVIHDGGKWFGIGLTDSLSLDQLGEILATPGFSPARKIHRALNLDGGTSSGFYLNRGEMLEPIHVEPFKKVRNFVGIVPRG